MKALLPVLIFLFVTAAPLRADKTPAIKAAEAAAIAQEDLASRGLDATIYIAEVNYKKGGLLGGEPAHWEVLWSKDFDAQTQGRKEIGLKIKMDGSYTRSVR